MLKWIRQLLEKESFDCMDRYGVGAEGLLIGSLRMAPSGSRLDVSEDDAETLRKRFSSWAEQQPVTFAEGVTFRVNELFVDRLEADLMVSEIQVPDLYCIREGDSNYLLTVMQRSEVLDFAQSFDDQLKATLAANAKAKLAEQVEDTNRDVR